MWVQLSSNCRSIVLLLLFAATQGCQDSSSPDSSSSSGGGTSTGPKGPASTTPGASGGGNLAGTGGNTNRATLPKSASGGATQTPVPTSTTKTEGTGGSKTISSTSISLGGAATVTSTAVQGTGGSVPLTTTPPVTTCPSKAIAAGDTKRTVVVGGLTREYILHVPSAYKGSSAAPLVVDFHHINGSASGWRNASPYPAVIDGEGVISAFPDGKQSPNMGQAWNVEGCCTSKINGAAVDDVAFAKALVADVATVACIDLKRVYAVGFSMGGGMSHYLGCHASDVFAAIGPAAFDLLQQNVAGCAPTRPLSVIFWRGKKDGTVPYAGGHSAVVTDMAIDFLGAVATFEKWAKLNNCTGTPSAADANGCQTYASCGAGTQVTLCTSENGDHEAAKASVTWPMLKKYSMP